MEHASIPLPAADWPIFQPGWVWLVGAGPGDPGLLTLHAVNALRQADVIVHDALVNPAVLAWAPQAEYIDMGKRGGKPSARQAEISARLVDLARAGRRVLRLKGGDPFVFGRGGEEAEELMAANIPLKIIPGITAGIGGLAYAGLPVTHRDTNQAVTFVTGHDRKGQVPGHDWAALSKGAGVLVIYMGIARAGAIAQHLLDAGRAPDTPCAVVMQAACAEQTVLETTLATLDADLQKAQITPPALLVIGRGVLIRQDSAAPDLLHPLPHPLPLAAE